MKNRILHLILSVLLCFASALYSQDTQMDSLLRIVKNSKENIEKVEQLLLLSDLTQNPEEIANYSRQAIEMSKKLNYKKGLAYGLNNLGYYYSQSGQATEALQQFKQSLAIYQELKDKKGIAEEFNNIGAIYNEQGDLHSALDYFHKSLKIRESLNDKTGMAVSFNQLGGLYQSIKNDEKAFEFFNESYMLYKELNDITGMAQSLNNLGSAIRGPGNQEKALQFYFESLALRERAGNKADIAQSLNNVAAVYTDLKEYDKALGYFEKSVQLSEEIGDLKGTGSTLSNMGRLYLLKAAEGSREQNLAVAEKYCLRSMEIARQTGSPRSIRNAARDLYRIYKAKNNGMKALEFHELYTLMKDSINNIEIQNTSVKKQMQYEFEQKEAFAKAAQEKKDAISAEEKRKEKVIRYSVLAILLVVIVFSFSLFSRLRIIRQQKTLIENQKHIVEEKQKEILDSIHYAKRIQRSLLPSEFAMDRILKKTKRKKSA